MLSLDDVRAGRRTLHGLLHRTPLIHSTALGERAGVDLFLKCENLQKTGSFKPRGQINKIARLSEAERARGIIVVSAGNAAQGCAYAARRVGAKCVVVMPETAPQAKVDATRGYGAQVIQHGTLATLASMFDKADELQREHGYTFSHAFNDWDVMAGQASIGVEILEDLADVDAVFVSIGGGGLISGVASGIKLLAPRVRIIGVESEAGPGMQAAMQAGEPVRIPRGPSIADGMGAPFVGDLTLQVCQQYVDEFVTVSDAEIIDALKLILQRTKMLVEGAGAASVAGLLSGRAHLSPNARVACVLSGGNIDLTRVGELLLQSP